MSGGENLVNVLARFSSVGKLTLFYLTIKINLRISMLRVDAELIKTASRRMPLRDGVLSLQRIIAMQAKFLCNKRLSQNGIICKKIESGVKTNDV